LAGSFLREQPSSAQPSKSSLARQPRERGSHGLPFLRNPRKARDCLATSKHQIRRVAVPKEEAPIPSTLNGEMDWKYQLRLLELTERGRSGDSLSHKQHSETADPVSHTPVEVSLHQQGRSRLRTKYNGRTQRGFRDEGQRKRRVQSCEPEVGKQAIDARPAQGPLLVRITLHCLLILNELRDAIDDLVVRLCSSSRILKFISKPLSRENAITDHRLAEVPVELRNRYAVDRQKRPRNVRTHSAASCRDDAPCC
jgi:hypothetical protein